MTFKVYAHFVADLGSRGCSEFRGIVEVGAASAELPAGHDDQALVRELARDFNVGTEQIHVLRWSRLH